MRKNYTLYFLLIFTFIFSCQKPDVRAEDESAKLIVRLTDAPFPHNRVAEVNISLSELSIVPANDELNSDMNDNSKISLLDRVIEVNLLQLVNGVTLNLANKELEEGDYGGFELFIEKANVVLKDDTKYVMNLALREEGGYRIFLPKPLKARKGLTKDILLDFDVARSFMPRMSPTANMGIAGFVFNPFIKVSDNDHAGSMSGFITSKTDSDLLRVAGAQVSVFYQGVLYTSTFTDASGMFTVLGLPSGIYEVLVQRDGYLSETVNQVEVSAGQETETNIIISAVL